jgi:uncharacterized membrane protein
MKEIFAAAAVLGLYAIVSFLNRRILAAGGFSWRGRRIQPRGNRGFPIVATTASEVERKNPVRWIWSLVDLLVLIIVAIWFLAKMR